jgi:hypothetical protein
VPSSTSSFEPRALPAGRWRATWLVACAIAVAGLGWIEHGARAHRQRPSVIDDPSSWAMARRTVDDDPKVVAFIGASRTALGYSASAFATAAPSLRGVQLGIDGELAFAVLDDLAQDAHFQGVVVFDLIPHELSYPDVDDMTGARDYVERGRHVWRAPGAIANRYLAGWVQSELALLAMTGRRVLSSWLGLRRWPQPSWVAADRQRGERGDYSLATPQLLSRKVEGRVAIISPTTLTPDEWWGRVARDLEPRFRQIRSHGGDVVVIHMPISGKLRQVFDAKYPRAQYWDVFAARSAAHVLHFLDVPGMAQLTCGDEMHLDERDQVTYTRALVDELRRRGWLRE